MGKEKQGGLMNASARDGVEYRKASIPQFVMAMAANGGGVVFYLMIGFATMAATQGFGIATITAGVLLTVCRVWDGVTDPIIAAVYERMNPKHGKIRIFMVLGWAVCSLGLLILYCIAAGRVNGVFGIVMFVFSYGIREILGTDESWQVRTGFIRESGTDCGAGM